MGKKPYLKSGSKAEIIICKFSQKIANENMYFLYLSSDLVKLISWDCIWLQLT